MTDDERDARRHVASLLDPIPDRPMRVLVTGSRNWIDANAVRDTLERVRTWWPPNLSMIVVHGACHDGADIMAAAWAEARANAIGEPHPARWYKEGHGAGLNRNTLMVELGADVCTAFIRPCVRPRCNKKPEIHGSHGTIDCAHKAREAGIPVWRVFGEGL